MEEETLTYQLQYEDIWGRWPVSKRNRKVYYSIPQAIKALKLIYLMNDRFRRRCLEHSMLIYLVHLQNGEQIARQQIQLTN